MNFFQNQSPPPPPPPPPTPRPRRVRLPKLILPLSFHLPVSTLPLLPVTTAALALTSTLLPRSRWNLLQFIISISTLPTPIPFLHFLRPLFLPLLATKAYSLLTRLFFPTHDRTLCFWRRALPIYAAYKTTQAQLSIRAPPLADSTKAWNSRHTWAAARVYALCTELRGFYLKDGQYLGTRTDVVPQAWCLVLRTLQDRVPQIPFHEVEQTIKDAYCINQLPQVFQSIHTVPLASATIAQVHRATMPNGSPVVIKAQYCDQQQLYEKDLRNLRRLGRFLQSHKVPFFDMACVMGEFEKRIPLEFDFLREAEMMTTIRLNLKRAGINDIVIPKLVPGLVSQRVLTMSFIEGCRPDNSVAMNLWGIVPKDVVKTVGRAYGQMLLCDGVAHCDPHFGNLIILRDKRVGLIDFGQSKEIPRPLRQKLCAFYLAVSSENNVQIMHAFQDLGVELDIRGNDSKERVTELISYLANSMLDTAPLPPDIETNPFSGENFFKQVRVKKFNPELFMVLRAMGLLRSLAETLGINSQDCWMSSIFKPYALRGIRDTEPSEQLKQDRSVAIRAALRNSVSSPFRDPLEDEAAGYCSMN